MSDINDDGGPAFPNTVKVTDEAYAELRGMTLRQYAAIHLRVPDSGLPWLDEMISASKDSGMSVERTRAMLGMRKAEQQAQYQTCPICGAPQFNSPSGVTCPNGHGALR